MHPSVILDNPMADEGEAAAILIMRENQAHPNDFMLVASVHVYDRMKARRIWSVCASSLYKRAQYQARLVRNKDLRERYRSYLHEVCPPGDSGQLR